MPFRCEGSCGTGGDNMRGSWEGTCNCGAGIDKGSNNDGESSGSADAASANFSMVLDLRC